MGKKKKKYNPTINRAIIILYLIMFGISSYNIVNVESLGLVEPDSSISEWNRANREIAINSSGVLVCAYVNETNKDVMFEKSLDDGVTWGNVFNLTKTGYAYEYVCLAIDSEDKIYIAYQREENDGNPDDTDVFCNWSTDGGSTWFGQKICDFTQVFYPWGVVITVTNDDDVFVIGSSQDTNTLKILYRKFTHSTSVWSGQNNIYNGAVPCVKTSYLYDAVAISNDSILIFYIGMDCGDGISDLQYYILDSDLSVSGPFMVYDSTSNTYELLECSVCVDLLNRIHIVYNRENGVNNVYGIYYRYLKNDVLSSEECLYYDSSYPAYYPTISYTFWRNHIQVLYQADCLTCADYTIFRIFGSSGDWSDIWQCVSGSDKTAVPESIYQRYPDFNVFASGIKFLFYNSTTNQIWYANSSNYLWWDGENYITDPEPGFLYVNCYDEINGSNITGFNILIINQEGDSYYNYNLDNTFSVPVYSIPDGECLVTLSAMNYYPRSFNINVIDGLFYYDGEYYQSATINAYLPPINLSHLYYIQVIDEYLYPVEDARVLIKTNISDETEYVNVSDTFTDGYGMTNAYLCWGKLYMVTISKEGFTTKTETWIPDPSKYGIEYPKVFKITRILDVNDTYDFWDVASLSGTMYLNNTIKVVYTEKIPITINASFYTMENYNFTNTLINITNITSVSSHTFWITNINSSRQHQVTCYLNHSLAGNETGTITISPINITRLDTKDIEKKIKDIFGPFDLGYVNTFLIYIPAIVILILPGILHPGLGAIGCGLWLGATSQFLDVPSSITILIPFIIIIGILLMIVRGGRFKL